MNNKKRQEEKTEYEEIKVLLEPFDRLDLISKLAGLRLHPKNANRSIRLDYLIHIAASMNLGKGRTIKRKELQAIGNSKLIRHGIARNEDPMSELFCTEIGFFGGGHRIFPGPNPSIVFNFKSLLKTIFLKGNSDFPSTIKDELRSHALFVLKVSEKIAEKADIKRYARSESHRDIFVPFDKEMEILSNAVIFKHEEIEKITLTCGTTMDKIKWLFSKIGEVDPASYDCESGDLLNHPILQINEYCVITDPASLLSSFMIIVLARLKKENLLDTFAQYYNFAIWDSMKKCLEEMKIDQVEGLPIEHRKNVSMIDGVFILDIDKALVVFLLGENFLNLELNSLKIEDCQLEERREKIVQRLCCPKNPPNEIMFLYILSFYRRAIFFEGPILESPSTILHLSLTADSLEMISFLEGGKKLFLYKYARAYEAIRQNSMIQVWDPLAEYEFFRSYKYSYYISDNERPGFIWITEDFAQKAKFEAMSKIDPHSVYNPDRHSSVEVKRLHGESLPLYITPNLFSMKKIEILLENLKIPIWFFSEKAFQISFLIIDMLGYWFYELRDYLNQILEPLSHHIQYLKFYITLSDPPQWAVPPTGKSNTKKIGNNEPGGMVIEVKHHDIINLKFYPDLNERLYGETNEGERFIIFQILKNFSALYDYLKIPINLLDERFIREAIDKFMPLGRKKKVSLYNSGHLPELDPTNLSEPRLLDPIDVNLLLDEIGEYIVNDGLSIETSQKEQSEFINDHVVKYFWQKLQDEIRSIKGNQLLLYLISQNEAITRKRALLEMQLPMRLEIRPWEQAFRDYSFEYKEVTETAPACRFLVECAASIFPSGLKPISHALYDRLLAISSAIITWGLISDAIANGIGDIKIRMLPSGRIGQSGAQFDKAFHRFSDQYMRNQTNRLIKRFPTHWEGGEFSNKDEETKEFFDEVSNAIKSEFGFSLQDIAAFGEYLLHTAPKAGYIIKITEEELIEELGKQSCRETILNIIKAFSLCNREDYFSHPGYESIPLYEFFPWRFNRQFSHMRRPILKIQNNNDAYLLIGFRHWRKAMQNFINLLNNGRLLTHARTKDFKRLITKLSQPYGKLFNNKIANLLKENPQYKAYQNVTKFGKIRLEAGRGNSLGDIDVLAINVRAFNIYIIECKDLSAARSPYELKLELRKVFEDENSLLSRHQKRTEWIKENLQIVLDHYKLIKSKKWKVRSLFVVNEPLFSSHLKKIKGIRILSYEEFKDAVEKKNL